MNEVKVFAIYSSFEQLQNKLWRTNRLLSLLNSKSSALLNMCSATKNIIDGSEGCCISNFVPSPPCPHFILNHKTKQNKNKNKKFSLARFSMTPLIGHYRISQGEHIETSPPSSCLAPFGSLSKCPSAFCSSSKNSRWLLVQVPFVKTFSLHLACLPQWLVLCRHSAFSGLCCISFSL